MNTSNQSRWPAARRGGRALLILALGTGALAAQSGCTHLPIPGHHRDVLAITDQGVPADPSDPATLADDSVKFFDAKTGRRLRVPDVPPNSGLVGPAAVLFGDGPRGGFLVVNQNQLQPVNGEVRHYDAIGRRLADIVPATDRNGPLAPRGAVLVDNRNGTRTLFVADQGDTFARGKLLAYTLKGNEVVDKDNPFNLDPHLKNPDGTEAEYHPRAVVLGPDGYLYVSEMGALRGRPLPGCGGRVLRFDPHRRTFIDVVVENSALCKDNVNDLHRPEGLVFSPAGNLYVTSFRQRSLDPSDPTRPDPDDPPKADDNDRILVIPKRCLRNQERHDKRRAQASRGCRGRLDRIDLWRPDRNQPRAFAQALLFGPGGELYVPISNTGEVRAYDVYTKGYRIFIPANTAGGPVGPQYLSFGKTNPATLAYEGRGKRGRGANTLSGEQR